jgi:hypothetical protein
LSITTTSSFAFQQTIFWRSMTVCARNCRPEFFHPVMNHSTVRQPLPYHLEGSLEQAYRKVDGSFQLG